MKSLVTCELRVRGEQLERATICCGDVHHVCLLSNMFLQRYDRPTTKVKLKYTPQESRVVVTIKSKRELSDIAERVFKNYFMHTVDMACELIACMD